MIIYEVNLTINQDIFSEYYRWLIKHIETILKFSGFCKAEIAKEKLSDSEKHIKLAVRYILKSEEDLNNYLELHAPAMREDGIKRFGNQFSASRRDFTDTKVISETK